jgi:succinylglutamate desuccinylase
MLSLGNLLSDTLSALQPVDKIQFTADGARLRWLAEGALEVTPAHEFDDGSDLLLSAGVHGNETAPIEMLDRLVQRIASGTLKPSARVLFLLGNPEAMRAGVRYVENDVNRLFFGRHESMLGYEALRAADLERLAAEFFSVTGRERLHYDLHTAIRGSKIEQFALYPWSEGRTQSRSELARLYSAGIQAALLQKKPGITFSAYTYSKLGAEAFTLELGKARPFGHNQGINLDLINQLLESLIAGAAPLEAHPNLEGMLLFTVSREVIKQSEGFRLHLDSNVENFTELEQGYLLAEDADGIRWTVDEEAARIVFPNSTVAVGLRAGLLVVSTAL